MEKKQRNLIAIDETAVKANKKRYYVFSAIDVERNELILMRRRETTWLQSLSSEKFLIIVRTSQKLVVNKAPWLRRAIESLGLEFEQETFREAKSSWIYLFIFQAESEDFLLLHNG